MTAVSVYDKAIQLTAHAMRLAQGAAGELEANRVAARVQQVRVQLATLRQQILLARKLNDLGVEPLISLADVDDGRANFERKAESGGHPSDTVFKTAGEKIKAVADRLRATSQTRWTTWAQSSLDRLPMSRITTLSPEDQKTARTAQGDLKRAAAKSRVSPSDITLFATTYSRLAEMLNGADELPDAVVSLIERLERRPPLTLDQVSDQDIALLRRYGLAGQISVLRKGA